MAKTDTNVHQLFVCSSATGVDLIIDFANYQRSVIPGNDISGQAYQLCVYMFGFHSKRWRGDDLDAPIPVNTRSDGPHLCKCAE
jgi:hypothetical protein